MKIYKKRFQKYQNNLDQLLHILSGLNLEKDAKIDLLSSAFLLAGIDGEISQEETRTLDRLAAVFSLTNEDIQTAKNHSHALVDTMKELRVLS